MALRRIEERAGSRVCQEEQLTRLEDVVVCLRYRGKPKTLGLDTCDNQDEGLHGSFMRLVQPERATGTPLALSADLSLCGR